jgi:hypothetical protein
MLKERNCQLSLSLSSGPKVSFNIIGFTSITILDQQVKKDISYGTYFTTTDA